MRLESFHLTKLRVGTLRDDGFLFIIKKIYIFHIQKKKTKELSKRDGLRPLGTSWAWALE